MAALRHACALLLVASLGVVSGCGKKGQLVPPDTLVPAPVSDLSLDQRGERFQLAWSAPSKEEGGAAIKDLSGFLLLRRVVLPPAEDCEECPTAYKELAHIDLDYPQGFQRMGRRYQVTDSDLQTGKTYQYKLRAVTSDGTQSKDSNKVRHTVLVPPPPPFVEATPRDDSVLLTISAQPPAQGKLTGFNVYRAKPGQELPKSPVNEAPLTSGSYEDRNVVLGQRYSYAVTSIASVDGETVESLPSKRVEGAVREPD